MGPPLGLPTQRYGSYFWGVTSSAAAAAAAVVVVTLKTFRKECVDPAEDPLRFWSESESGSDSSSRSDVGSEFCSRPNLSLDWES